MEDRILAEARGVAIPRVESQLVARFGPAIRRGIDLHAIGPREKVHRKLVRGVHRVVMVPIGLGAHEDVLGVRASTIIGRVMPLADLWGSAAADRLLERIAARPDEAAAILEGAIIERAHSPGERSQLALVASKRLVSANVNVVAGELGVSERHLRRVFRATVGVSPKTFAQLARFRRALSVAHDDRHSSWAGIAVAAGYYDQAHLITEFRAIAGVTPRALLREMAESGISGMPPRFAPPTSHTESRGDRARAPRPG